MNFIYFFLVFSVFCLFVCLLNFKVTCYSFDDQTVNSICCMYHAFSRNESTAIVQRTLLHINVALSIQFLMRLMNAIVPFHIWNSIYVILIRYTWYIYRVERLFIFKLRHCLYSTLYQNIEYDYKKRAKFFSVDDPIFGHSFDMIFIYILRDQLINCEE